MRSELRQKFRDRWPEWFSGRDVGFDNDDGWFDLELRLCEDLAGILGGQTASYKVLQVKEKFGTLRWYALVESTDAVAKAVLDRVLQAERESAKTCEQCGSPGRLNSNGIWLKTLCDRCAEKLGGFKALPQGGQE